MKKNITLINAKIEDLDKIVQYRMKLWDNDGKEAYIFNMYKKNGMIKNEFYQVMDLLNIGYETKGNV